MVKINSLTSLLLIQRMNYYDFFFADSKIVFAVQDYRPLQELLPFELR